MTGQETHVSRCQREKTLQDKTELIDKEKKDEVWTCAMLGAHPVYTVVLPNRENWFVFRILLQTKSLEAS